MPINFHTSNGVGVFTTIGDVDYLEGIEVLTHGLESIQSSDPLLVLFDLRQSLEHRSTEEVAGIADLVKPYVSGTAKIALLAEADLYFGLSRIFSVYVEDVKIAARVFREYDQALSWLTK